MGMPPLTGLGGFETTCKQSMGERYEKPKP